MKNALGGIFKREAKSLLSNQIFPPKFSLKSSSRHYNDAKSCVANQV
jgi:hypothetical protein